MNDAARRFLAGTKWADAHCDPVAGDLSARAFFRLTLGDQTAILMDANGVDRSTAAFVDMARWLRKQQLSAPEVFSADVANGFLLLEDFGRTPVSAVLTDDIRHLCVDLLLAIRKMNPPQLTRPDASELVAWTGLVKDFYPNVNINTLDQFLSVLETVLADACSEPRTVSLRDFHVDNLMWLPNRQGIARLGILDFQDAFLCHPVYDLVSLLTDARTDVSPDDRTTAIRYYLDRSQDDPEEFALAFAAFSVQRNLRILGIFHRAAVVDGKPHHLAKVPRVRSYLSEALRHPAFAAMRDDVLGALPLPDAMT